MKTTDLIQVEGLRRRFDLSEPWLVRLLARRPKRFLDAVDDVSFSIERGKTYALVGESGSGKSTIALIAVGLLRPSSGHILIDGHNLYDRSRSEAEHRRIRQRLQMVFQSPYASLNPRWRVGSILAEPLRVFGLTQGPKAETLRVHELLEQVGLSVSDASRFPHEFSGGQRQRISASAAASTLKWLTNAAHLFRHSLGIVATPCSECGRAATEPLRSSCREKGGSGCRWRRRCQIHTHMQQATAAEAATRGRARDVEPISAGIAGCATVDPQHPRPLLGHRLLARQLKPHVEHRRQVVRPPRRAPKLGGDG